MAYFWYAHALLGGTDISGNSGSMDKMKFDIISTRHFSPSDQRRMSASNMLS